MAGHKSRATCNIYLQDKKLGNTKLLKLAACHLKKVIIGSINHRYLLKVLQMSDTALKTLSEKFTFTFTYFMLGSWSRSNLC